MTEISEPKSRTFTDLILIALLCTVFFWGLSFTRPLASPDEGRYSEIPREMAASGDWVTPRLNGVEYFYKPPMFYWMQASSIEAFGINRMSLRLPNSLMAVFGVMLTYLAASSLYGRRAGIFSAIVVSTSLFYYAMANIITLDMTVSVFLTGSLFSFILAWREKQCIYRRGLFWISAFAFSALAVMTKGLIGILIPACVAGLYLLIINPITALKSLQKSDFLWLLLGIVVFSVIAVPWHVLASLANPAMEGAEGLFSKNATGQGFAWYYFINEHFLRYLDAETSHRNQPFWFFFAFAPLGFVPWIVLLPRSVKDAVKGGWQNLKKQNPEFIFFCVWVAFVILFFSISKSKLLPYILPIYPALAVIVGSFIAKVWDEPKKYNLHAEAYTLVAIGFIAALAVVPLFYFFAQKGKIIEPVGAMISFGLMGVFLFLGALVTLYFMRKFQSHKALISLIITIVLFLFMFNPLGKHLQRPDAQGFAEIIKAQVSSGAKVIAAKCYNQVQDLPVWLNTEICLYNEIPGEQLFGYNRDVSKHAPRYMGKDAFAQVLIAEECFVVCKKDYLGELMTHPEAKRLRQISEHGKLLLLTNKPDSNCGIENK